MATSPAPDPAPPRLIPLDDLEQAWQRCLGTFAGSVKQTTLEIIDDVARKHGNPLLGAVRQALVEAVVAALKSQETALLSHLKPAFLEGTEGVRQKADTLLENLKQFIATTVGDIFRLHVPEYSRWAGQRILDHFLAGTFFCLAAIMLCVGGILGLEHAGLPPYAAYLVGGTLALLVGLGFLKLRVRRWSNGAKPRGESSSPAGQPEH